MKAYQTIRETAEELAVTQKTVLAWIQAGELRAANVGRSAGAGRPRWRVSREAVERFLASRQPVKASKPAKRKRTEQSEVIRFF